MTVCYENFQTIYKIKIKKIIIKKLHRQIEASKLNSYLHLHVPITTMIFYEFARTEFKACLLTNESIS